MGDISRIYASLHSGIAIDQKHRTGSNPDPGANQTPKWHNLNTMDKRRNTKQPDESLRDALEKADISTVINTVLDHSGLTLMECKMKTRKGPIVLARHTVYYLLSINPSRSFSSIGTVFGLDHATAINSRNTIEDWIDSDNSFRHRMIEICQTVIGNSLKKTIQVVGKITGLDREEVIRKFQQSEIHLKSLGYKVINPVTLVPETETWEDSMRSCLQSLLTVDAIAVQPDWYLSKGAQIEYMIASSLSLDVIRL